MHISKQIIHLSIEAARLASIEIRRVYSEDFHVITKSDGSPVTLADQLSSKYILETVSILGFPVLSEEEELAEFSIRKNWKTYWLIDPLDGTKEFVKKNGEFCINIALMHNNLPVFGLISSPLSGFTMYGSFETGLWTGNFNDPTSFENISNIEFTANDSVRIIGSRSHHSLVNSIPTIEMADKSLSFQQKGSALKFIELALNRADVYYRQGPTMEWDTAAGDILLQVQGGEIIDENGKPLQYNKESLLNPSFIAKTRTFTQN
jgi:3'(2'), 5'-bisphosphate nucleotidase